MALVALFAALVSLTSIGAFFGGQWPLLDLVASFRPHLTVATILAALILLGARWHRSAGAAGVIGLVSLAVVAPLFIGPGAPPSGEALRVMSFNLLSDNDRYEEVIDYIALESPDVVILHEVSRPWEEALAAAGLGYEITRGRSEGLIFGSLVMAPAGSTVQSFGFAKSNPRAIEVILPSRVAVLGIHPLAPFPEAETERRIFQFEFAALWALAQNGPRVIAGDFNAGPWSHPFRRLLSTTGLSNSQNGFGLELTYPADSNPLFQVSIDHLLHSHDLAVAERRLGPAMGSDHLPLIVDLVRVETP